MSDNVIKGKLEVNLGSYEKLIDSLKNCIPEGGRPSIEIDFEKVLNGIKFEWNVEEIAKFKEKLRNGLRECFGELNWSGDFKENDVIAQYGKDGRVIFEIETSDKLDRPQGVFFKRVYLNVYVDKRYMNDMTRDILPEYHDKLMNEYRGIAEAVFSPIIDR